MLKQLLPFAVAHVHWSLTCFGRPVELTLIVELTLVPSHALCVRVAVDTGAVD